jgi:DNA-binding NtrC family response regulator
MVPETSSRAVTIRPGGKLLVWSANEASGARLLQEARNGGFEAAFVGNMTELRVRITQDTIAVCVLDEPTSLQTVRELAAAGTTAGKQVQFVVLPAVGSAYADGANAPDCCDVLRPPMSIEKLRGALFRAAARAQIIEAPEPVAARTTAAVQDPLTGNSQAIQNVRERVREVAQANTPVMVIGPRGSGTNVVARAIHSHQFGMDAPFVVVRCAVLTGNALEHELFGDSPLHAQIQDGLWAAASGGTLVLDDIDQVPLVMQHRLVRLLAAQLALASRPSRDPSAPAARHPRVIATTHEDLEERVRDGRFDPELYRLLRQTRILVPTLAQRGEDLVPLASLMLTELAQADGRPLCRLTADAVELLRRHAWTDNVRQLRNVLSRGCSLFIGGDVTAEMLRPWLECPAEECVDLPGMTLREMERKLIEATFNRYAGNREMTAKALQIGLRTLSGKLREYGYPPRGGPGSNRIRRAA